MKLYKVDYKEFNNGDIKTIYSYEKIKDLNELKNFLLLIKNHYGEINDIIVKKDNDNGEIKFYKRYRKIDDFINNYNLDNFNEFNIYEFLGNNIHFKIDILKNIIDIYQSKNNLVDDDVKDYEYYKFENGLIVRFNKINAHCAYLDDNNEWILRNSLITMVDDAAYKYEIIENPLATKNK